LNKSELFFAQTESEIGKLDRYNIMAAFRAGLKTVLLLLRITSMLLAKIYSFSTNVAVPSKMEPAKQGHQHKRSTFVHHGFRYG